MAENKLKIENFSEVEKDDIFSELFVESFLPELLKNPQFNTMRTWLENSQSVWETPPSSGQKPLHDAVEKMYSTVSGLKSRPDAISEKDRTAILNSYRNVYKAYSQVLSAATASAKKAVTEVKAETAKTNVALRDAEKYIMQSERDMKLYNKSLADLEAAKRKAEREMAEQTRRLKERQRKIENMKPLPGSVKMRGYMVPSEPGIDFVLPWQSASTERNIRAGYRKEEKVPPQMKKGVFLSPKDIKKSKESVIPFRTNAAEHAKGIDYSYTAPDAKDIAALKKMFGVDFRSASRAGSVPRNKRLGDSGGSAAAYGTAVHALFEMADKQKLSYRDFQNPKFLQEIYKKEPKLLGPAFLNAAGNALKPAVMAALSARTNLLRSGAEETLLNETGVGAFVRIGGKMVPLTATIDRVYRDKGTGEVVVEDYKNEKYLRPFAHLMQLKQEAMLLNANNGLIMDNNGNAINLTSPITRARIAQYNPHAKAGDKNAQKFVYYDLGSDEDFIKTLELIDEHSAGKISEAEFVRRLPSVFRNAYSDEFSPVRRESYKDAKWLTISGEGLSRPSSILFNGKGKPTPTNELFDLWKKDRQAAMKVVTKAFTSPLVSEDYKRELYWKLYSLERTVYPPDAENVEDIRKFAADLQYPLKDAIIHPDRDEKDAELTRRAKALATEQRKEEQAKRDLDTQIKNLKDLERRRDEEYRKNGIIPLSEYGSVKKGRSEIEAAEAELGTFRSSLIKENKDAIDASREGYLSPLRAKLAEATAKRVEAAKARAEGMKITGSDAEDAKLRQAAWEASDAEDLAFAQLEKAEQLSAWNEIWLRENSPEYRELRGKVSTLKNRQKEIEAQAKKDWEKESAEKGWDKAETIDERYKEEEEEILGNIERITSTFDWFVPDSEITRTRESLKAAGVFEYNLGEDNSRNAWGETADIRDALYTATHYHPEFMGEKIKALAALLKEREAAFAGTPEERDAFMKRYRETIRDILGDMHPDTLGKFKNYLGNGEGYSAAQAAYASAVYENQALGLRVDDEEMEKAVMSHFDSSQTEDIFGRYLRLRDKILHGYIGEVNNEDRVNVAKAIDAYLMPQNKDAIDLVGTLTGGMARFYYGADVYEKIREDLQKEGKDLTSEQTKELSFGHRMKAALQDLVKQNDGKSVPFHEFFRSFGDDLLDEFGSGVDANGNLRVDVEGIQSKYGDAAYGWIQRYLRFLNNPSSDDELEQMGAEAFARSKGGMPRAFVRFFEGNTGSGVANQGMTAAYLIQKGIPLSALHYERGKTFLDLRPDQLADVRGMTEEELEQAGILAEDYGQWKLFDSDYDVLFKEAIASYEREQEKIREERIKKAEEEAKKEESTAPALPATIEEEPKPEPEPAPKGKGSRGKGGSKGGKKGKGKTESGPSVTNATIDTATVNGDKITIESPTVSVAGGNLDVKTDAVHLDGSGNVSFEIPNGIVYNEGNGPVTQNIYTTGSVILQGGDWSGRGGAGQIGSAEWSNLPGPQRYQYLKNQEFALEGRTQKEQQEIDRLSLYGKIHSSEIAKRKENITALASQLEEVRKGLAEFDKLPDDFSASYKSDIDKRFADKRNEREADFRVAQGKLDDKKKKIAAEQRDKDSKELESLYEAQSSIMKKMMADKFRFNTSTSSLEKKAISELNVGRLQEIGLIQKKIEAAKGKTSLSPEEIANIEKAAAAQDELNMLEIKSKNKGVGNLWDSLATSFKNIFTKFTQMGLAYSILGKLKKGLSDVTQSAQQLDKAMVNLRVVTGASYEEAKTMVHGYAQLGHDLAATTLEVSTAAQEWLRQGYDVAEVNRLVESSIKLSVLGMMSASDATKALTSAMKGFKMEAGDVSEIVDKFTSLDMKAATTAGDIATALSKFAATAQMAGVDIDQAAAMATTIMDVSQNDAGATGNALKTIFSRFGNVKAGAYEKMSAGDSDDTTEKLNDIERVLSTLGIQIRFSAREMRDFDDVLDDVAEKWQFLDKVSQNAIATALAGTRQRESFAVLMNNYDKYKEFIEVSRNSAGTADKKYESYLEQLEASQKRLKAAWEDFANSTEIAGFMTNMNNFLSNIVKWLPMIIRYVAKLAITLKSYKMPKLLKNFFGVEGSWKDKGKGLLHGLTSAGLQENAAKYNEKESHGLIDTIYGPARRVANAFNMVAEAAERAYGVNAKETVAATSLADAENAAATASYSGAVAFKASADSSYTVAQANTAEANASMIAANADMAKAGATVTFNKANMTSYGGLAIPEYGSLYNYTAGIGNNANKFNTNVNSKKSLWNNLKPSKAGAGMAAVGGLSSVAMGLTMGSSGNDLLFGNKQGTFEASKNANTVATVNSTLSNIGYIWGPIVGMLANTLADMLNKFLIIPLIDREANERKARVEQANKLYEQISGLSDNLGSLTGYAKKTALSADETNEMTDEVYKLLSEYYNMDTDARSDITKYLIPYLEALGLDDLSSIYDVLQAYMKGDANTRDTLARALQYAEQSAALEQATKKDEEKNYNLKEQIKDLTRYDSVADAFNRDAHRYIRLEGIAREKGFYTDTNPHGHFYQTYIDPDKMSYDLHEYIEMIDEVLNSLDASNAEEIQKYQELKEQVADLAAVRKAEMDAYNKQAATNALLITKVSEQGGYLLNQNIDQLKYMGSDQIMRLVAEQIAEAGGFSGKAIYVGGDEKNGLTEYAQGIIMQAVRSDPTLAAALSGTSYSISDLVRNNGLYNWEGRQKEYDNLVASFSSALHMTSDEFLNNLESGELVEKFGNMTLGDFLKTPEELRQSMEDLSSLFQSLSNNAFLTAENLEKVINNYPSFIQYLGDTANLMDAMVKGLAEYAQVYTTKIYDQLISSTEYAEGLKAQLYSSGDYDTEALRGAIGGATTVKGIIEELKKGPQVLGLSQSDYDRLTETFVHLFNKIDIGQIFMRQLAVDTVIPYLDTRLDRELDALNKQKEALEQINKQREYENKLIEARNKLEEASKEKTRVWREGVGWVYEANQDAIAEAQKNLQEVENERQIRELDIMIDQINAQKELIKAIQDDAKFKALEEAMSSLLGTNAGDTGINGLINITRKLYNGDSTIAENLGDTGKTLSKLKTQLATLLEKQFGIDYSSDEYSASKLKEIAEDYSLSEEQRQAAKDELKKRGYHSYRRQDGTQGWSYEPPGPDERIEESDITAAIEAYNNVTGSGNREEIGNWLKNQGYAQGTDGKWRKAARVYQIKDKDHFGSKGITGSWNEAEDPLSLSSDYYKWIEEDFKNGKAAYYELEDGVYQWRGDIEDHKTRYFDDLYRWIQAHDNVIINGWSGGPEVGVVHGGSLYGLYQAALGSLGLPGGPTLLNERGTEAIVTPYGTVTSLPSGTGVVPADVTKNLWALGEVAPAISRLLEPMVKKGEAAIGDSFSIQNMVINMNPDGSFDVDSFVNELKSAIALRKNS